MKFEFTISEADTQSTKQMILADKTGRGVFYLELCFAHTTIVSERDGEPNLTLGRIPFLNLISDLKFFIEKNSNRQHARENICGFDQHYGLGLQKNGITLKLIKLGRTSQSLTLRCPRKAHELDYPACQFLEEYLRLCPELSESKHMDFLRKNFHFKL